MAAPRPPLLLLLAVTIAVLLVGGGLALQTRVPGTGGIVGGARALGAAPTDKATAEPVPVTIPRPVAIEGQTGVAVPVAEVTEAPGPPTPVPAFAAVPTYRAAVAVDVTDQTEEVARTLLAAVEGVQHVAAITVTQTSLGGVAARLAEVQVDEFRPFTPAATANHQPLWERVQAGDIAVTHEFATVHEVELGTSLATGRSLPTGRPVAFRVGALATNGTPPVAEAIVQAGALGGDEQGVRRLLVGLEDIASPQEVVEVLRAEGLVAEEIADPRLPSTDVVIPTGGITPENVWDHLALCESSGDWHINTGNGYYGGVQFLPESWAAVGGQGLPHEHTKEEQIYRATLLWQIQGWNAWPQCARKLGLIVDPPPQSTEPPQPVQTEPPD